MATFAAPTRKRATRLNEIIITSGAPEEALLGRQVMYSLPDEPCSGAKLMRSWVKHGLDENALPEARQKVDVFRSACSSVQERVAHNNHGQRVQILANAVVDDGTAYQITVRRWDTAQRVIEHEMGMRVVFDKQSNVISVEALKDFDPSLWKLLEQIQDHFDANASTVPGQKVRNAIRQTILDCGGQNLRRKAGGVYFVPRLTADGHPTLPILEGLRDVLRDMYGDDADFDILKWGSDANDLEIVRKHFALNANAKAKELSDKAWKRVREGKGKRGVRSDLIDNLSNERRALLGQVKHFEQLVQLERDDVRQAIDELDEALEKLDELADTDTTTP